MKKHVIFLLFFFLLVINIGYSILGETPSSTIEINIPDYTVEEIDGYDYVDIPGGNILLVEGKPRVPYCSVYSTYPKGYRIQDVVMKERSGLVTTTGLNLTTVTMEPVSSQSSEPPSTEQGGWYPKDDFNWSAWINSDGSSTLVISIFPFYYNSNTTDVKFYKNYRFDIEYIVSNVEITALSTDKDIYAPGDEVAIAIWFNNSGESQDVIVSTVIKQYVTDEIVDGLPFRTLKNFVGKGSYSADWKSNDTDLGDYYAETTLTDTSGNVLDKKTVGFGIQTSEAEEKPPEGKPTEISPLYLIIGIVVVAIALITLLVIKSRKRK